MPLVENAQSGKQFTAEIGGAPVVEGQCGERPDDLEAAGDAAEVGLDAPQGDDEARRHADGALHLIEEFTVLGSFGAGAVNTELRDHALEVLLKGNSEFGLRPVELNDPPNRLQSVERLGEDVLAYAGRRRLSPQFDEKRPPCLGVYLHHLLPVLGLRRQIGKHREGERRSAKQTPDGPHLGALAVLETPRPCALASDRRRGRSIRGARDASIRRAL